MMSFLLGNFRNAIRERYRIDEISELENPLQPLDVVSFDYLPIWNLRMPPAISRIGDAWEVGKINISTEHLATNYLRQRLLMWMLSGPPTRVMNPILMACGPDEWHEGSLLVLGSFLRRRRWPVAYLGQSVPLDDLAEFVRSVKPSLLILVAMTEESGQKLIEWPKFMPEVEESGRPIVGYGGRIFSLHPEWRLKMKGLFLGNSFKEGLETIERLL